MIRDLIFISYSHNDIKFLEEFQTMLAPMQRDGAVDVWADTRIQASAKWRDEIEQALKNAKAAVLLVSPKFLASDFIDKHELPPLLKAAKEDGLKVFWVCLRPCLYDRTEIGSYQAIHSPAEPLVRMSPNNRGDVWMKLCKALEQVAPLPSSLGQSNVGVAPMGQTSDVDTPHHENRPSRLDSHHQTLASRLLADPVAKPFYDALTEELARRFRDASPQSASDIVQMFVQCPADDIKKLFWAVRRVLKSSQMSKQQLIDRKKIEEAAAAMYCLAACQLVDQAAQAMLPAPFVVRVPSCEPVICAVIATALFGGELHLLPSEEGLGLPRPQFMYEVRVPAGGDYVMESFERAVYVALFSNDRASTEISLDAGPLDGKQRAKLEAHIENIREVENCRLSLVIQGLEKIGSCSNFASQYQVPLMLPDTEATAILLGIHPDRLLEEIKLFWDELEILPRTGQPTHSPSESQDPPGATPMPSIPQITGDHNTVIFSTGDHSALQSGTGNSANITHREGSGLSALTPLLAELLREIGDVPLPKAREKLTAHVQAAQAEAAKPDKPDPDVIKNALVKVKSSAEMLEDGGKIIGLCNHAYNVLATIFGLPPSPLP